MWSKLKFIFEFFMTKVFTFQFIMTWSFTREDRDAKKCKLTSCCSPGSCCWSCWCCWTLSGCRTLCACWSKLAVCATVWKFSSKTIFGFSFSTYSGQSHQLWTTLQCWPGGQLSSIATPWLHLKKREQSSGWGNMGGSWGHGGFVGGQETPGTQRARLLKSVKLFKFQIYT